MAPTAPTSKPKIDFSTSRAVNGGRCEVFLRGPVVIARWTPPLGDGYGETKAKRPLKYTFGWTWKPGWSSPIQSKRLRWLDVLGRGIAERLRRREPLSRKVLDEL